MHDFSNAVFGQIRQKAWDLVLLCFLFYCPLLKEGGLCGLGARRLA
jgi:hypothetical protein